jgi:hypothetical protein
MFSVMIRRNVKDIARLQTTENLISDTLVPDPTKVKTSSDIQIPTLAAAESTTLGPRNVRAKPPNAPVTALRLLTSLEAFLLPRAAQVAAAKRRSKLPMVLDLTIMSKCNVLETPATRISAATNKGTAVTSQPSAPAPRDAVARMTALTAMTVPLLTQMTASGAKAEDATDATLIPIPAIEGDQPTRRKATQRESTTRTTMPTIATRLILAVIMTTTMTIFMMTTSRDPMLPMTKKLKRLRKKRLSRMRLLRRLNEIGELINN